MFSNALYTVNYYCVHMISPHSVVAFTQTAFTVFEGQDSFVTLEVSRSGNLDLPANVSFMTEAGTAFEGRAIL